MTVVVETPSGSARRRLASIVTHPWSGSSALLSQAGLIAGARLLGALGLAASSALMSRLLGPEGRGQFAVLWTIANFGVLFASFGLTTSITFFVAREPSSHSWIRRIIRFQPIATAILTLLAILLVRFVFPGSLSGNTTIALVSSAALSGVLLAPQLVQGVLLAFQATRAYALADLAQKCILVAVPASFFLVKSPDVLAVIWGLIAAFGCLSFLLTRGATRALSGVPVLQQQEHFVPTRLMSYSLRPYVASVLLYLVTRVSVLILNAYRGPGELGLYASALSLAEGLALVASGLGTAIFARASSRQLSISRFARSFWLIGAVMTLCWSALFFLADPAVRLLYGPRFASAAALTRLLLPGSLFMSLESLIANYLAGDGYPWTMALVWAPGLAVNLGLNLFLVPQSGAQGASIAYTVSHAVVFCMALSLLFRRMVRHPTISMDNSPSHA